ncbi:hypothetical protein LL965_20935 [Xanthomonas cassavae CFBP 4642]|uniref:Uncharacterized protein n=2 Tax=Xanthomonas cassavae TaxID=56450 RepID=A0ABS8HM70_9XANT|nr:hypothetical protein [Xanthomonas cassavae]MCC4622401.1 hypothetical protein [Xanthomonas cassavae CFBP 4642]
MTGVLDNTAGQRGRLLSDGPREWMAEPMVRCSDGRIRRYPPSKGTSSHYVDQVAQGLIYDIPSDRVTHRFGSIEPSADRKHASFVADGYSISPIQIGQFKAYPLPGGRFMVPQLGFKDCTHACELMMLLDHGAVSIDDKYKASRLGFRREMLEIMESLQSRTGRTSQIVTHRINYKSGLLGPHESRKTAWRDLSSKIDEMGPCILSKGGHVVMLDKVREEKGNFYLTIREPFHGTSLEFRDTSEFFRDHLGKKENVTVEAVFLGASQNRS